MSLVYRGFETSLLALAPCLGLGALAAPGTPRAPAQTLSVSLPMPTVTVPAAR